MKEHLGKSQRDSVWQLLLNKYRADPEGFSSYLPEIAETLEKNLGPRIKQPYRKVVTELERQRLLNVLLPLLNKKALTHDEAIQVLEYCATLIQDVSLPPDIDHKTLVGLLRQALGGPLGKLRKATRIPVCEGEVAKEIALLRGVHLHLTWNDRLVAVSVLPAKVKERSRAVKIVGIAKDVASNVAKHHNDYFAGEVLSASS